MSISADQTIWYPGLYIPREDGDYGKRVVSTFIHDIVALVQKRAKADGEWAIENGFVGDHEDKMRRMMAWVSDEKNIRQCVAHIFTEKQEGVRTVDWVCRDLANASKWSVK